ncbi:MAG: hypothetical protein NTU94_18585, partial [Planctomycetota bacterium]|nr:hypothetical protein [Planctomycetota bacterium]
MKHRAFVLAMVAAMVGTAAAGAAPAAALAAPSAAPSAPASAGPATPPAPAGPPTVAILNYEMGTPDAEATGQQIADILTVRLSAEDSIALVERAKLGQVLAEQKLKLVGLADQDKAVEVGKLLGARLMVLGKSFTLDKRLVFVTKLVGVETGRVKGTIRTVEPTKPLAEAILQVGDDVAALIQKESKNLLPEAAAAEADPLADVRKALADRAPPAVAVVIPEVHLTRVVRDPAAETEIKRTLIECGFKVVDAGANSLADWAKKAAHGDTPPWPEALRDADVVIVGEAFSEFALRTGDLVTCTARVEINAIDRHTGRIIAADRQT